MADETKPLANDVEKIKRYLQWATALVMVCITVTVIDLMIKNGILRAVKEADGRLSRPQTVAASTAGTPVNYPADNVGSTSGASENGHTDATIRVSRTPPPAPSEEDQPSGDELRVDEGSGNG